MTIESKASIGQEVLIIDTKEPKLLKVTSIQVLVNEDKTSVYYKLHTWDNWIPEKNIFINKQELIDLLEKL